MEWDLAYPKMFYYFLLLIVWLIATNHYCFNIIIGVVMNSFVRETNMEIGEVRVNEWFSSLESFILSI